MKKIIFVICVLTLGITVISHTINSLEDGMAAQFCLGVIQIIIALGLFIKWKKHNVLVKRNLKIYWGIVLLYGMSHLVIDIAFTSYDLNNVVFWKVIPMSIATYFTVITYLNMKQKKEIML
ncbi:hypothetical protein [Aquimarina aquimarini]|uniref:hypothetical protein n=1 Tax=Aquimarina aquimarini TaxID=1191734 RepID=UPI001F3A0185|nr:hypothetical protein [Aquimarina aquimarini]